MAITSANQLELLQTAEAVAREKMIEPELVIEAMEDSLARAAKSRYGSEMDIRVKIDRKTGNATFTRARTVVDEEELENYQAQLTPAQAKPYFEAPGDGRALWIRDGAAIEIACPPLYMPAWPTCSGVPSRPRLPPTTTKSPPSTPAALS